MSNQSSKPGGFVRQHERLLRECNNMGALLIGALSLLLLLLMLLLLTVLSGCDTTDNQPPLLVTTGQTDEQPALLAITEPSDEQPVEISPSPVIEDDLAESSMPNGTQGTDLKDLDWNMIESSPENLGITLEFLRQNPYTITLLLTNNSGFNIRYGDGSEVSGKGFGYVGTADLNTFDLPSGEQCEIQAISSSSTGFRLGYGEFRIRKNIIVDPDNPSNAKAYKLYAEFAIENATIPPDMNDVTLDAVFATPVGAIIEITNGFADERIYYDKSFRIERSEGSYWQTVALVGPDYFTSETVSTGQRQISQLTIYWAWLYGELEPGHYRIAKDIWSVDNPEVRDTLFADYMLDGQPISDTICNDDGSTWSHPFGGITTFRAEVTELLDPNRYAFTFGDRGFMVSSLTSFWDSRNDAGDRFIIWDNFTLTVLDVSGKQISFSDIRIGSVVDTTFSGMILTSNPAIIGGTLLIQLV